MRVVIQRVSEASVKVDHKEVGTIGLGYLILLGVEELDDESDVDWLCNKVVGLRIFNDSDGKMNLSLPDVNGKVLLISQFTLHANIKKGNRPSFIKAAKPEIALPMYEYFQKKLTSLIGNNVETGEFGADMQVSLINDGPVTITMDSKNRE